MQATKFSVSVKYQFIVDFSLFVNQVSIHAVHHFSCIVRKTFAAQLGGKPFNEKWNENDFACIALHWSFVFFNFLENSISVV